MVFAKIRKKKNCQDFVSNRSELATQPIYTVEHFYR